MAGEHDSTTVLGLEGYDEEYSLSEFTEYFNTDLSSQKFKWGWVFWRPEVCYQESYIYELGDGFSFTVPNSSSAYERAIQEKIKRVLEERTSTWHWQRNYLVQFWAAKTAGQWCYLSTSDQPFAVDRLHKGFCWYRKHSVDHHYIVDEEAKEDELGAVGRVFRKGHPESSPDLRLYSDKEFPLRDHAARCGARKYIALPVFDLLKKECYGVLEFLSFDHGGRGCESCQLLKQLQAAELRSTHMDFGRITSDRNWMPPKYKQHERGEIAKMLELAVEVVPQLHMAQAWLPCKQCAKTTSNLSCMERVALITGIAKMVNSCKYVNFDLYEYLQACEFHNLQIGNVITKTVIESNYKSCFCRNICDFSISENPLAHYARKARLSFCFAICLESVHNSNEIYVVEFFLQSNNREDAYVGSFMHLLSRIMKMKLNSFKVASGRQFREELAVEVRKNMLTSSENMFAPRYEIVEYTQERNHQSSKEFNMLMMMKGCRKKCSVADFTEYLQTDDLLSCSQPPDKRRHGWLFWCPEREDLAASEVTSNSFVPSWVFQKQIRFLLSKMISKWAWKPYCLVQFWALKMDEDRCYLSTSGQPFALGCLYKGLGKFRKQCMEHKYFVDEEAKEEELGPPGRVFRGGHPEMTLDLRLYSIREFPLRNHAVHCRLRRYIAQPILDHQHKCVGILEFLEFGDIKRITKALEEANLSSAHINLKPTYQIIDDSLNEIKEALQLVTKIPQLYMAEVWVSNNHCATINNNLTCITRALSTKNISREVEGLCQFQHVQTGKGIAGMVLASENKSCFCQNSCEFSIIEQPQAHYAQRERLDVCFAICLQSSLTGNILYILNFFLNQCPGDDEYLWSFCYLLLPMLKQKLKSFKVASGQQLGDELVVEVIKSSHEANQLSFSDEFRRPNIFPLKFKIVQYDQNEHDHLHSKDQQENFVASATEPKRCHTPAINSNKRKKIDEGEKMKSTGGLRIRREDLIPHFGKRLKDVSKELRISRSTIKRACRYYGITRWPCNERYKENPSLFENETQNANKDAPDSQQNMWPSGGSNLPPSDLPSNDNVPQTNPTSTQQLTHLPADTEMVIIKAKYEEGTIKFQLPLPSRFNDLEKQVASRLTLNIGGFKLKYLDEDNDEILLTCDVDLQLCLKNLTGAGKTCIQLFVQLIRE